MRILGEIIIVLNVKHFCLDMFCEIPFHSDPLRRTSRLRPWGVTQTLTWPWSAPSSSRPGWSPSAGERADSRAGRCFHPGDTVQGFSHLPSEGKIKHISIAKNQCWASYSTNVIYYSLQVTLLVTYYFLARVISYTTSYITVSSRLTEVVKLYLPHTIFHECY